MVKLLETKKKISNYHVLKKAFDIGQSLDYR